MCMFPVNPFHRLAFSQEIKCKFFQICPRRLTGHGVSIASSIVNCDRHLQPRGPCIRIVKRNHIGGSP